MVKHKTWNSIFRVQRSLHLTIFSWDSSKFSNLNFYNGGTRQNFQKCLLDSSKDIATSIPESWWIQRMYSLYILLSVIIKPVVLYSTPNIRDYGFRICIQIYVFHNFHFCWLRVLGLYLGVSYSYVTSVY